MQNRKTCELLQVHDITVLISDDSWRMGRLVLPSRSVARLHYTNTDIYLKHHLHLIYAHPGNIACPNLIIIILKVIDCFNIRFRNIWHMEWSASERPRLLWMTSMIRREPLPRSHSKLGFMTLYTGDRRKGTYGWWMGRKSSDRINRAEYKVVYECMPENEPNKLTD